MRPDQHKKKKNAEYKKKHGIPKQVKKKDKETGEHSKRSVSDELSDETERPQLKPRNCERIHDQRSSDSDEDRKDEEERDHGVRLFSRRKIESNLDRYKELDVPPSVSKIGADFQSLLHKTAGPSSHFLLQDEKEWGNIDENDSKVGSTLMSIDFKALAESLTEIPLDRRLGIDKKYLEDEPLYSTKKTTSPATDRRITVKVNAVSDNSVKQTFTTRNFNFSKPSEVSQKTKLKDKESDTMNNDKITLTGTTERVQLGATHVKKPTGNCITEEEDLDQLLGLTPAERNSDVQVTGIVPQNKECIQVNVQESIFLDTVKDTRRKIGEVLQPKAPQETKEDLEDWLDSILD